MQILDFFRIGEASTAPGGVGTKSVFLFSVVVKTPILEAGALAKAQVF